MIQKSGIGFFMIFSFFLDKEITGSVAIAQMLDRTNLIAIVSGGPNPIVAPNSGKQSMMVIRARYFMFLFLVLIWDDDLKTFALEFTFKSRVFGVRMSHKK